MGDRLGLETYVVGGYVRDILLAVSPKTLTLYALAAA